MGGGLNPYPPGMGQFNHNLGPPPGLNHPPLGMGMGLNKAKGLHMPYHKGPIVEDEMKEPKEDSEEESKADNKKQPKVSDLNVLPLLYIKNIA